MQAPRPVNCQIPITKEINMNLLEIIHIQGTPEQIWKVITDIEGSGNTISAIQDITILEKPAAGLVGLK